MRFSRLNALLLVFFLFISQAGLLLAQPSNPPAADSPPKVEENLDLFKELQGFGNSDEDKDPVEVNRFSEAEPRW